MSEQLMIQALTGPVAALVLCLFAIYMVAKWLGQHLPIWVERHLKQFDTIVDSHNQDREVYREGLTTLTMSMKELKGEVDVVKDDVKTIKTHIQGQAQK